jgi:hypothetical protein
MNWKMSHKGNLTCVVNGFRYTVFERKSKYGFVIQDIISDENTAIAGWDEIRKGRLSLDY